MSMATATNAQHAVEFLTWLFGPKPDNLIFVRRFRTSTHPGEARSNQTEENPASFRVPANVDSTWWEEQGHLWQMVYCTATVEKSAKQGGNNSIENTRTIPALWVDIDDCKTLGIPGEEFYIDLKQQEEISAWVRSSANGTQGYFKLDTPYEVEGDKERFSADLKNLLWDICLYFGGDSNVLNCGRLMRLPGSLNLKREYSDSYMAHAKVFPDKTFSLKDLRTKFKGDPDVVPRLVAYACSRALTDIWQPGERHSIMLRLAGTVRKQGINREACLRLYKELSHTLGDDNDRDTEVGTTYDNPLEEIATLRQDYEECAKSVEDAIAFWLELKIKYCKKRGFEFHPENEDPTAQPQPEGAFWEQGLQTWFHGREDSEIFANFIIHLKGKVIKADTYASVWMAEILKTGEPPTLVEIPAEKHVTPQKFLQSMPVSGMSIEAPTLWAKYISYLDKQCPDSYTMESPRYGIIFNKKVPIMLLPGETSTDFTWTGTEDTAEHGALSQVIGSEEATAYLQKFGDYYKNVHEPRFIWPSLGWFAACAISEFVRQSGKGFPTLTVCGLPGSGKSHLFEKLLGVHYGCQISNMYDGTTAYALRTKLASNNVCPLYVDEFRMSPNATRKSGDMQAIIRSLWDQSQQSRGLATGGLHKDKLVAPLLIVGEHHYTDQASVERTFTIRLNRSWVDAVQKLPKSDLHKLEAERAWLYNSKHRGWLGSLILSWVRNHFEEIPAIIKSSEALIAEDTSIALERKKEGLIAIIAGHHLLARVYRHYGLDYPLTKRPMLESLYTADTRFADNSSRDTETLRTLFEVTDYVITNSFRQHSSLAGNLFILDVPEGVAYFDMVRWYQYVSSQSHVANSGSLTDKSAFMELLKDHHASSEDSPFVDFPQDHPAFKHSCVTIDLKLVSERYGINVEQWKGNDYGEL
jgi:hypothetical protein